MGLWFGRVGFVAVVAVTIAVGVPAYTCARELATAKGTIAISEARPGTRAPSCSELIVEARDALDNHLIAETQAAIDEAGACRYTLSVPAQSAVWLRAQPVLVAATRVVNDTSTSAHLRGRLAGAASRCGSRLSRRRRTSLPQTSKKRWP